MESAPRPRTTEMTFWSRYDPIRQPKGNTDHWAKYRQQTDGLHGNPPGNYMEMRPRNSANKALYRNQYHDRARDNFRYWLIERPKPTSFGKYGLGSYKTVLGIGNAPRT